MVAVKHGDIMCDPSYVQSEMSPHLIGVADVTQCGPAGLARRGVPWDDSCSRENASNVFTFPPTTTSHFPSENIVSKAIRATRRYSITTYGVISRQI